MGSVARFLVLVAALMSLAGTRDPNVEDSEYLDAAEPHAEYTLTIEATREGGDLGVGTAVAISDSWAITAAHIVHEAKEATVRNGRRSWKIRRIVCHSGFQHAMMGQHDIALLEVSEPLGLEAYPPLADGTEAVGDDAVVVGYGAEGTLDAGWKAFDGRLRAGTNTICRRERNLWVCHGAAGTSPREMLTAPGDSGGPLLVRGRLAGIHSIVMREGRGAVKSTNGQESGHTNVSEYLDWIEAVTTGGDLAWTPSQD
jgi:hypothetical protein